MLLNLLLALGSLNSWGGSACCPLALHLTTARVQSWLESREQREKAGKEGIPGAYPHSLANTCAGTQTLVPTNSLSFYFSLFLSSQLPFYLLSSTPSFSSSPSPSPPLFNSHLKLYLSGSLYISALPFFPLLFSLSLPPPEVYSSTLRAFLHNPFVPRSSGAQTHFIFDTLFLLCLF